LSRPARAAASPRRSELLGRAALVALGLGLAAASLGALELGLRATGLGAGPPGYDPLSGFSSSVPLFVPAQRPDGTAVLRVSPARLGRLRPAEASDPLREFLARKPSGGFRAFVVGESSAAGVPYDPSDSFAGGLARALAAALPGVGSEVVNAAVSGYGSRRELLAVREIAGHAPDLVVFYGGHNEPWERGRYGRLLDLPPPLFAALERLVASRLFTLASRIAARGPESPEAAVERFLAEDQAQTLELFALAAARKAGERLGGEAEAERWYRENLDRIADAADSAGARLVLVTLGQDLVSWPPAASSHRPGLSPEDLARWTERVEAGRRLLRQGRCPAALERWREALAIDDAHAELHYLVAGCERRLGRFDAARRHYELASDLDRVPLGAPSRYNEILRELARRRGAILVDAAAALEAASPHGLVGAELFADFLHPNLRGHQVIAAAITARLRESGLPRPAAEWSPIPDPPALEEVYAARPDYRRREGEMALVACLLAQRAECAEARARSLQRLDPGSALARNALAWAQAQQAAAAPRDRMAQPE
jgi:lysophospholipase L1-like esterase